MLPPSLGHPRAPGLSHTPIEGRQRDFTSMRQSVCNDTLGEDARGGLRPQGIPEGPEPITYSAESGPMWDKQYDLTDRPGLSLSPARPRITKSQYEALAQWVSMAPAVAAEASQRSSKIPGGQDLPQLRAGWELVLRHSEPAWMGCRLHRRNAEYLLQFACRSRALTSRVFPDDSCLPTSPNGCCTWTSN